MTDSTPRGSNILRSHQLLRHVVEGVVDVGVYCVRLLWLSVLQPTAASTLREFRIQQLTHHILHNYITSRHSSIKQQNAKTAERNLSGFFQPVGLIVDLLKKLILTSHHQGRTCLAY